MVNVLIADDNILFSKKLMDEINSDEVRICNLSINGEETLKILNNKDDIDIILLKLNLPKYDAIQVIDMLSDLKKQQYEDSFIIFSEEKSNGRLIENQMIHAFLNEKNDINKIIESVNELINEKKIKKSLKNIRYNVYDELKKLHFNITHKGTQYLIDAINIIYIQDILDNFDLKNDIYPKIAKKYHKSIHTIKADICKATDYMDINCSMEYKRQYFNFMDDIKPTVKVVICAVLNNIYQRI